MEAYTKWWARRCLKCQALKTSRQTVCCRVLPMSLPNSPGIFISVDYFEPLPTTARGNSFVVLFTDQFSHRADMLTVTAVKFTAEGPVNILVNRLITLWGWPSTLLSATDLNSALSSQPPCTNCSTCVNSQQTPIALAVIVASNVSIALRHRC